MVVTFTKSNVKSSGGSGGLFNYLDKENQERIDEYLQNANDLSDNFSDDKIDNILIESNLYFNQNDEQFKKEEASKIIDENLSSNAKKDQSQFFMVNISPSKSELEHLEKIAEIELKRNGIGEKEVAVLNSTEQGRRSLDIMKNDLMHQQMREYTKDVMKDYADNFNREVYANPELLPSKQQEREISSVAKQKLMDLGINEGSENFNSLFVKTKQELAVSIGKDLSTRKMTENDLVWFGKVEEKRTYKPNDKWVMQNKKISKKIEQLRKSGDKENKIPELEKHLNVDKTTGRVVEEGMPKGGLNYHAHVVVSRYDKCENKDKKISLSPMANQRTGDRLDGKKDVGFDRDNFRNKVEKSFDYKFRFQRLNTYEDYKRRKNIMYKSNTTIKVVNKVKRQVRNNVSNIIKSPLKPIRNEIRNMSGKNELNKLSLQSSISKELGFRIPLKLPPTPYQGAVKIVRSIVGKFMESSRGY